MSDYIRDKKEDASDSKLGLLGTLGKLVKRNHVKQEPQIHINYNYGENTSLCNTSDRRSADYPAERPVSANQYRESISQSINDAYCTATAFKFFFSEILIIAAIVGICQESWWWFLGILLGCLCTIKIPFLGHAIGVLLGVGIGTVVAVIVKEFQGSATAWVVGIIVSIIVTLLNLQARKV